MCRCATAQDGPGARQNWRFLGYRGVAMATPTAQQINAALHGFDALYGLELLDWNDTEAHARVPVREEVKQPAGLLHGGVYAAVAESLASMATALAVAAEGSTAVGLSNSTSFPRPITEGVVHAHATRLHRGRTTWVWDVRFSDDADRLCAVTRMTIAVRPLSGGPERPARAPAS
jgi:1,4-dihydroxy-2-naphthoyl-CoA hydrolase